jgi:peptidoglycan/xylan/chitin deacetylase (PgdA/CDA1 family)
VTLPSLIITAHDVHRSARPLSSLEANTCVGVDGLWQTIDALRGIGYRFVPFREFMSERRGGAVALLTFDDGYRTVRDLALPELAVRGVPAVVFLVSSTLRRPGDPFPHWLHVMRDNREALGREACAPLASHPHATRVVAASGFASLDALLAQPLGVPTEAFRTCLTQAQLDELGDIVAGLPGLGRVTMTEADIKGLTGAVEFGVHSVTHRSFALLEEREIEFEVSESAAIVSQLTGEPPDSLPFAYPYGAVTEYAERTVRRVYRAGFTCQNRPVSLLDSASTLPRINLDAMALRNATAQGPAAHLVSSVRERVKRYVRTGPPWTVLGPARDAVRRLRSRGIRP